MQKVFKKAFAEKFVMKVNVHKSDDRGVTALGWLFSRHSFSFGEYYNPQRMGFGLLRVLNDDVIDGGKGFGLHPHDNMEIVTIVLEGALEHNDSAGNKGVIRPGDVQRMSAGRGIIHSEYNHSKTESGHFLQIWVETAKRNIQPEYEQKSFGWQDSGKLIEVVSGRAKTADKLFMHQDGVFLLGGFDKPAKFSHALKGKEFGLFVFVISGKVSFEKNVLSEGDSAEITGVEKVDFSAEKGAKVLLIEVPMKQ